MIKASIIIPAYNAARYVRAAVDSALAQTHPDIEIIVVDDGSTDDTRRILDPYAAARKIEYLQQENKGLSGARNAGIRRAKGEYIALLDADDIFMPDKMEKQIAHLERDLSCDVSYCDLYHFWDEEPEKSLKLDYKYYSGEEVLPNILRRSFIAPSTTLYRRRVFDRFGYFDEEIRQFAEDLEFWLRLTLGGAKICFLPEILVKLRLRREGSIQGLSRQPQMKLTALKVVEDVNAKMSAAERAKYGMSSHLRRYRLKTAFAYLLVGEKPSALEFVAKALENRPSGRIFSGLIRAVISVVPIRILQWSALKLYYFRRAALLKEVK
ncbi:hypothetical protein A3C19_00185 [Candidatus Kaiserbacteria bacterium RIFCSPHIGHO2_02_FULL_54_22]|uniref:Glycosyltransferase 2-like domain-containing protein n=1 Tax=Candidatus Kaiserbacteria bacterium RIFCSPHIGHO2_02_FULL_54_22 TaxID=1798495 RepID=A0A1F6DLG3_9BACT|nr:MAG: hypothetical protein A3C19_00185 [Candidatus Kaiserbacteria bacterium RIFCSPHIGHO2_02_FULL_54_22]